MKNKFKYILSVLSVFACLALVGCTYGSTSENPSAEFSNLVYDTETHTVTFDVNITDNAKKGSNYQIVLSDSANTISTTKEITDISSTVSSSFDSLTDGTTYVLNVTSDYDSKTNVIGSKYFTASADTETSSSSSLGVTYSNSEIEYDGQSHYLYASYGTQTITSDCINTIDNVTYKFQYDKTNSYAKIPGTYTYNLYIYKITGTLWNRKQELVDTLQATLTINKASSVYNFSDETMRYTGEAYTFPVSLSGLTYTICDSNGETSDAVNPGTYTVSYSFTGNDYYNACTGSYTLTISKALISSYLTNQIVALDDEKNASVSVDSSDFSISGLNYSIKYYDLNGNEIEKITTTGTYIYEVTVLGNDYYETLVDSHYLYVTSEETESVFISRVTSFSVESSNGRYDTTINYYNYVELFNQNSQSVDLSKVSLSISGTNVALSGTLAGHSTYTVLVYSYSKTITFSSGYNRYQINFTNYSDYAVKNTNEVKLTKASITYNNITRNYTFETSYDDYNAILNYSKSNLSNNSLVYSYTNPESIEDVVDILNNYTYTNLEPTLTYNSTLTTISETRINELYDVSAYSALGEEITVTEDMVDTSSITSENVGKTVKVIYNITDSYGNVSQRERSLIVVDEEKPIIELNEGYSYIVDLNANVDLTKYFTAYDAVDGTITITSDMISGSLDTSIAGAYPITITVSDKAGNIESVTFTIRVGVTYTYLDTIASQTIKTEDTGEANAMPSSGNVRVLVVPIAFSSTSVSKISAIEAAFNGSSNLANESVASYYNKSSYGKLNLTFDVYSSWVKAPKTYTYYDDHIEELITYALNSIKNSYDFSNYDSDSDGYIDSIWFIYDMDYVSSSNYFWAWTSDFSSYVTTKYNNKSVGKIAFASLEFTDSSDSYYSSFAEYKSGKYTARTYIHETGHLLGLEDYYDYDYDKTVGVSHCMLGQSMMDENIGDLDAASKLLLGWVNPVVISESDTVTISSTALGSENVILISKNIKTSKTIFSEFILLEFWTADVLNSYDSDMSFGSDAYGIRVLHLDSTINYVNGVATLTTGSRPSYYKYNNTDDDTKNYLETLALNPSSVYNSRTEEYTVKNNVLFADTNKVFGKDYYSSFTYNNGNKIDFTFQITNISSSSVTISVTI